MAIDFIPYGVATPRQSELRNLIKQAKQVRDALVTQRDMMSHMNDGANWTALESEYGIAAGSGDDAFAELDSYLAKVNSDASISAVKTALDQLVAKMG